jgi:hypothetical protein
MAAATFSAASEQVRSRSLLRPEWMLSTSVCHTPEKAPNVFVFVFVFVSAPDASA